MSLDGLHPQLMRPRVEALLADPEATKLGPVQLGAPAPRQRPGACPNLVGGPRVTKRSCAVDGCSRPAEKRAMCGKHYQRWRTKGDPLATTRIKGDDLARFYSKVEKTEGCHNW